MVEVLVLPEQKVWHFPIFPGCKLQI